MSKFGEYGFGKFDFVGGNFLFQCMHGWGGGGRWVPFFPYPHARKRALKKGLEVLRGLLAA